LIGRGRFGVGGAPLSTRRQAPIMS